MKKLTEQQQKNILYILEKLLNDIRSARYKTGEEHKNKKSIDDKIIELSNKLDRKHYKIFESMIN